MENVSSYFGFFLAVSASESSPSCFRFNISWTERESVGKQKTQKKQHVKSRRQQGVVYSLIESSFTMKRTRALGKSLYRAAPTRESCQKKNRTNTNQPKTPEKTAANQPKTNENLPTTQDSHSDSSEVSSSINLPNFSEPTFPNSFESSNSSNEESHSDFSEAGTDSEELNEFDEFAEEVVSTGSEEELNEKDINIEPFRTYQHLKIHPARAESLSLDVSLLSLSKLLIVCRSYSMIWLYQ